MCWIILVNVAFYRISFTVLILLGYFPVLDWRWVILFDFVWIFQLWSI